MSERIDWELHQGCDEALTKQHDTIARLTKELEEARATAATVFTNYDLTCEQLADLRSRLSEVEKERDAITASYERARDERAALLSAQTTDGLSASEWQLRTALANKRAEEAEKRVAELTVALEMIAALAEPPTAFFPTFDEIAACARTALSTDKATKGE